MTTRNYTHDAFNAANAEVRAYGFAMNTAAAQQFLESCDAVTSYEEITSDVLLFRFDRDAEVVVVPPGAYFDVDACTNKKHLAAIRAAEAKID